MKEIHPQITLFELVTTYPTTKTFMEANDFDMSDALLQGIGKNITLEMALKSRKMNIELFLEQLHTAIHEDILGADTTLKDGKSKSDATITIKGVLPCPVRIPLLENFEAWLKEHEELKAEEVSYELQAASMGVEWLKEELQDATTEESLSDLFLSAGFDLFFDKNLLEKFKEEHVFEDFSGVTVYNQDFNNQEIALKDPKNEYAMIGVVPAVFLVNKNEIGDREMPKSWEDILEPEWENSVSLPVGDFDLFNAILLNIYQKYGEKGVKGLRRSFFSNLHPAEMVKSHVKAEKPAITIMPYFFTKMAIVTGPMVPIWPEDGAIISPIFMLGKKSKKEQLKPYMEYFASSAVGEILSHNGRFPSIHPEVDNQDAKGNTYMWIGWDYIENNDIGELIKMTTKIFEGVD